LADIPAWIGEAARAAFDTRWSNAASVQAGGTYLCAMCGFDGDCADIEYFCDEDATALCAHCGLDFVVVETEIAPIHDPHFRAQVVSVHPANRGR
jgi:hypothetical protein